MLQCNLANLTCNMETVFYLMHKTALGVGEPSVATRWIASIISRADSCFHGEFRCQTTFSPGTRIPGPRRSGESFAHSTCRIFAEVAGGAIRDGNKTAFVVLCVPDVHDGSVEIDFPVVKTDRFADPHPDERELTESLRQKMS